MKINTLKLSLLVLVFCILGSLQSCKKDDTTNESINNFSINWTGDLNKEEKDVIRDMIKNMVYVEGSTYRMGAQSDSIEDYNYDSLAGSFESPVHEVTLNSFYINKFELTQDVWFAVMGQMPTSDVTLQWEMQYGLGDDYPVYRISYSNAQEFIKKLNEYTGLKFSLPTEAQWEYAARGGASTTYPLYAGSNNVREVAWTSSSNVMTNHTVGLKNPNSLGLYDMSGNVWEMCIDWYQDYTTDSVTNPIGTEYNEGYRVFRGGSWNNDDRQARVTCRYKQGIHYVDYETGLRLAHPVE